MKYQAILFDLDGTLIDSFPPYYRIMRLTLSDFNRSAAVKDLKKTFSMSLRQAFNYLRIPKDFQGAFENDYLRRKTTYNSAPALFPGIKMMFKGLEKSLLPGIGIVTSGGDSEVEALKDNYTFMKGVWTSVTADSIPYHKPAPEPLLSAVNQMGIDHKQALYVGDAPVDMHAAHNAKMDFGIAGWGADPKVHFTEYKYRFKQPQDILKLF